MLGRDLRVFVPTEIWRLTEEVTAPKMCTAAETGIVAVLVVQCVTVKVLGAGKGLSAAWVAAAKLFLDAIGGRFGG